MRRFSRATIQTIVKRACKEFLEDGSAPDFVSFLYKGHYVKAVFEWAPLRGSWYLYYFDVVYSRSVMRYTVDEDFDICSAWCW